eukprot:Nk52_evm7s226 gene=Nk52_evmTU7s226
MFATIFGKSSSRLRSSSLSYRCLTSSSALTMTGTPGSCARTCVAAELCSSKEFCHRNNPNSSNNQYSSDVFIHPRRNFSTSNQNSNSNNNNNNNNKNSKNLNKFSQTLTQSKSNGASQAMLYATGLTPEDMNRAQVGISSVWYEGNPCNMHLNDLAAKVKEGVQAADLVGYRFNTIGVSDGISMGTDGMSFSLQSRDLIADSIETTMSAQWYDANISIPGCDKNMPG